MLIKMNINLNINFGVVIKYCSIIRKLVRQIKPLPLQKLYPQTCHSTLTISTPHWCPFSTSVSTTWFDLALHGSKAFSLARVHETRLFFKTSMVPNVCANLKTWGQKTFGHLLVRGGVTGCITRTTLTTTSSNFYNNNTIMYYIVVNIFSGSSSFSMFLWWHITPSTDESHGVNFWSLGLPNFTMNPPNRAVTEI